MSNIEWTEKTWNPTVGCKEVSPGCTNCYAAKMAWRIMHMNTPAAADYAGTVKKLDNGKIVWTGKMNVLSARLLEPARIKKPTVFFVDSMSDLFHQDIPFEFLDQVFAIAALCPQHTFQVLTKRPDRMLSYFQNRGPDGDEIFEMASIIVMENPELFHVVEKLTGEARKHLGRTMLTGDLLPHLEQAGWYWNKTINSEGYKDANLIYEGKFPLPNLWLGTSTENQIFADRRIPLLMQVPAAIRFLSCEPLLGPIDLTRQYEIPHPDPGIHGLITSPIFHSKLINWVIAGGESGSSDSRPMHPDWLRTLRDQCKDYGIAFFFKQWGDYTPHGPIDQEAEAWVCRDGTRTRDYNIVAGDWFEKGWMPVYKKGKKATGRTLDGKLHNEYPA